MVQTRRNAVIGGTMLLLLIMTTSTGAFNTESSPRLGSSTRRVTTSTCASQSSCSSISQRKFTATSVAVRDGHYTMDRNSMMRLMATKRSEGGAVSSGSGGNREWGRIACSFLVGAIISISFMQPGWAENELSDRYGGKGLDTSLVDQTCLVNKCSLQATACLKDDPDCRKGLTCTAKCMGDNTCITGCMARYGNGHLDDLLKCSIEDNECIKVAILPGGADAYGEEPRAPSPTIPKFNVASLQGSWYKVVGMNPNYDCYACQRNSFAMPKSWPSASDGLLPVGNFGSSSNSRLEVDVEFSMPRLLPDGSPLPPSNVREDILFVKEEGVENENTMQLLGSQSIALNDYHTHETMIFDSPAKDSGIWPATISLPLNGEGQVTYARTAHSEGEMFGLKFWENWYVIGENDPGMPEFKFIFYNGKTRQNTYEGAFVYSRTKSLSEDSMKKVYKIAKDAGMNPEQFCRIRNGCFPDEAPTLQPYTIDNGKNAPANPLFRGILASTRVSQLLGVEPVAARDMVRRNAPLSSELQPAATITDNSAVVDNKVSPLDTTSRAWWHEVGDYLENPHRHFQTMDRLRLKVQWPEDTN